MAEKMIIKVLISKFPAQVLFNISKYNKYANAVLKLIIEAKPA
jgi:hypothetical protein